MTLLSVHQGGHLHTGRPLFLSGEGCICEYPYCPVQLKSTTRNAAVVCPARRRGGRVPKTNLSAQMAHRFGEHKAFDVGPDGG